MVAGVVGSVLVDMGGDGDAEVDERGGGVWVGGLWGYGRCGNGCGFEWRSLERG